MTHAYNEMYLEDAMDNLADMLDYACLDCGYNPDAFWQMFLNNNISRCIEIGYPPAVSGRSGYELAYIVMQEEDNKTNDDLIQPVFRNYRSDLYWCGWVMTYYQWYTSQSFREIYEDIKIETLQKMYHPLHEADISKVVDALQAIQNRNHTQSKTTLDNPKW